MSPALVQIRNFRQVTERIGTSGQPAPAQFRTIRESGFEVVINLAMPTSDHAVPEEGSLVTGQGMVYVHLPVVFEQPTDRDYRGFHAVMTAFAGRPVFVHCAANLRVSAFVFLYRVLGEGVPVADAEQDLHAIWRPDLVWQRFIETQRSAWRDAFKGLPRAGGAHHDEEHP